MQRRTRPPGLTSRSHARHTDALRSSSRKRGIAVNCKPSQIAVIRTRLPYVDHRALSEAWFCALHLASRSRTPSSMATVTSAPVASPADAARRIALSSAAGSRRPTLQREVATRARIGVTAIGPCDGRSHCSGPRRAVPVLLCAQRIPLQATFTTTLGNARVRIAVRQAGTRLHVVAVCAARHAVTVRRALALAAVALQTRGLLVEPSTHIGVRI